ncbi:MAG: hypothetical protein H6741_21925 [Alphaproteobacteria bacterium]|nr:hypothetical protein [Alphaproteobacteria bacterium]MCB9795371.1 hypothetical protein [Alphaproteobacteria bacterium]
MTRALALLLLVACVDAPEPAELVSTPPPAELAPCGGQSALPEGLRPESMALPALTRRATRLASLGSAAELSPGAALTLHHVAVPQTGGPARACVSAGGLSGYVDRSDVAVLPFQAVIQSGNPGVKGKDVVVEGVEGDKVLVNLSGFFAPEPTVAPGAVAALDLSPFAEPMLLGDLDLAAWQPVRAEAAGGEGILEAPVRLRGLELPAGARLRWSGDGLITELELREAAQVGGRALAAGSVLALSQGCDFSLSTPEGEEACLAVAEGVLSAP